MHDPLLNGYPSPENPSRLDRILNYLSEKRYLDDGRCYLFRSEPATIEDILRVHTEEYVASVTASIQQSRKNLGKDTYLCEGSFDVLLQSVGAVLRAGEVVANGACDHSFALVRPPGHHAGKNTSGGFCVFNNSAILVHFLRDIFRIKRVAILNIDAHASDGTYGIFSADPDVLCISIHQDPSKIYPHTGFIKDIGIRPALGFSINMEMPLRSGNKEYGILFEDVIEKVMIKFDPEIVILECGFDAYHKESLSQLDLTIDGYYSIIDFLASRWKVVCLLEGGYHEDIGLLAAIVLEGLMGRRTIKDEIDQIDLLASRHVNTRKEFQEKLSRLKLILSPYWDLDKPVSCQVR
ncbi:MAG: histone deacetylase [Methanolobus sp.]|uniref:histone deacetylase family protein n=1 Tax=Methanolobus sp. TaxID=1874737 RepID=UPI002730D13D|nr:histone deacetylase [Methanolobus sp.]MDP2215732.1 histone deacetylase [Methanolobus sp.]